MRFGAVTFNPGARGADGEGRLSLLDLRFLSSCFDSRRQKYYSAPYLHELHGLSSISGIRTGRKAVTWTGGAAELARLRDCLYDDSAELIFCSGRPDHQRRPVLHVEIWGLLRLQCQRCLGRLDYPLQILNTLLLVRQNEALPADADQPHAPDCLEADAETDVGH
jgi:hypothetical protein